MKLSRLAAALTLSCLALPAVQAAKYRVIELPLVQEGVYSFGDGINVDGDMLATIQDPINPPIDIDLINFDSDLLATTLTDLNGARVGNINDDDLLTLFNFVKTGDASLFAQQLADNKAYVFEGTDVRPVRGFDVIDNDLQGYTRSNETIARGINDAGAIVGSSDGVYYKVDYRNESGDVITFVVRDHGTRGFLEINGETIPVVATEDTAGGISIANDINNSFEVAGFGTTEVSEQFEQQVEDCEEDDLRGDIPIEACIAAILSNDISVNFQRRAMIWEYDSQGNLIRENELGLLLTPEPGDTRFFESSAVAINDNGIAVGVSDVFFQDNTADVRDFAAVFDGDDVVGFTDQSEYLGSSASDINNNDIVVGQAFRNINGGVRTKFYYHDYQGEVTTYPDDFFESSSSVARAINDNNLVVGEGEVDSDLIGSRRRHAFLYDIANDDFQDLNDLISCDSPYTIVQGNDINNEDEISATAVIYRERRSITGDLALDERGNTIPENVTVAVKLVPIPGGSVDDCSGESTIPDRQGAGFFYWPLVLLVGWRLFRKR